MEVVTDWLATLQPGSIMHVLNYHIFNAPDRLRAVHVGIDNSRHTLYTALHLTAIYNQPMVAKLLLDKGAGTCTLSHSRFSPSNKFNVWGASIKLMSGYT